MQHERGFYIALFSVHGLIRGTELELGRDADTGGQVKYVVELARALGKDPRVERVDLFTRRVEDPKVDASYAAESETIGPRAWITRLRCGPRRYLRKEVLWPHLDSFADQALKHFSRLGRIPDVIHGHYADAGLVGAGIAGTLGVPFVFTGHSLGRVKRQRLIEHGLTADAVEKQYNISRRIEAEETALDNAAFVVASTRQEVEEQYSLYDRYEPTRMIVIPPGVDLDYFHPPGTKPEATQFESELGRFLDDPSKPLICALSRADPRKNLQTLVRAFGEDEELRKRANLLIVAGNRDDIEELERGAREVLTEILYLIDRYDLYGSIACPKHHLAEEVPAIYRLIARTRGVFVNPALTEPFGLTLIEAAASGVPIVATNDGGPRDILEHCQNGLLIDPLSIDDLRKSLHRALDDQKQWKTWAANGIDGANRRFSWKSHVREYLDNVRKAVDTTHHVLETSRKTSTGIPGRRRNRLPEADRILVSDIDNSLIGDREALDELLKRLQEARSTVAFGVATGRDLDSTVKAIEEWDLPRPDFMITSVGTEIFYGPHLAPDRSWTKLIDYRWSPDAVGKALAELPGLRLQKEGRRRFKLSYDVDPARMPRLREITSLLRRQGLRAKLVYSHQAFLDVIPLRASKGHALRYIAFKWELPVEHFLVAGGSGNDIEMLAGETLGVIVGNHSPEVEKLRGAPRIYFASRPYAWGILEGLDYYEFLRPVAQKEEVQRT